MKIAVVGSRGFKEEDFLKQTLVSFLPVMTVFISGGARGVDSLAEKCVDVYNKGTDLTEVGQKIEKKIFYPEWEAYGKRAGFLRNQLIIDEADAVLAFWDGQSKGTKHSIDLAIKKGIPVNIYVR